MYVSMLHDLESKHTKINNKIEYMNEVVNVYVRIHDRLDIEADIVQEFVQKKYKMFNEMEGDSGYLYQLKATHVITELKAELLQLDDNIHVLRRTHFLDMWRDDLKKL